MLPISCVMSSAILGRVAWREEAGVARNAGAKASGVCVSGRDEREEEVRCKVLGHELGGGGRTGPMELTDAR